MGGPWQYYIPRTLTACEWWQFYDMLEEVCGLITARWSAEFLPAFCETIVGILAGEGVPWTIEEGLETISKTEPQMH